MSSTVRICFVLLFLAVTSSSAKMMEELVSMNQQKAVSKAPFKACIDDSDCSGQGAGYACFQYICYPWADDSAIKKADRKATCKSNDDCSSGSSGSCFRHHDRRQIHRGLCMEPITDCSENGKDDCPGRECCNGQYCCGEEYFSQLKKLPCVNHLGCKDLGYGNFCCPPPKGSNSTGPSQCCNVDPNPPPPTKAPTTQSPRKASSVRSGSSSLHSFLLAPFLVILILVLRY